MSDTNQRPTPITDDAAIALHGTRLAPGCIYVKAEDMRNLERQLAEVREFGQRKVTEMAHRIAQLEYDLKQAIDQRNEYTSYLKATQRQLGNANADIKHVREQRDALATVLTEIRAEYERQVADPRCDCGDCEFLLRIDKALTTLKP